MKSKHLPTVNVNVCVPVPVPEKSSLHYNPPMEIIHIHFHTLSSTNDYAKEHIASFPQDKITLITADTQTQGRGQYGRKWHSPAANFYGTLCFVSSQEPLLLTRATAYMLQALLKKWGVEASIKWPNDLLVKNKKIGGILTETVPPNIVIIGIGLNVNLSEEEVALIDQPATSLLLETGRPHDIASITSEIKSEILITDLLRNII